MTLNNNGKSKGNWFQFDTVGNLKYFKGHTQEHPLDFSAIFESTQK